MCLRQRAKAQRPKGWRSKARRIQITVSADNYTVQTATSPGGPFTDHGLSSSTRTLLEDLTPGSFSACIPHAESGNCCSFWGEHGRA
jgi:hypothetical protein